MLRFALWTFAAVITGLGADVVSGQNFPNKPIRIVAGSAPGGGTDFAARMIAQGLADNLGVPVVVQNQGGANGIIAAQTVAKAPPSGYTLLVYSSGLWILPLIQVVPYDPVKDFSSVTLLDRAPNILVVHPSLAANSVQELIALAKASPGKLNYASGELGGATHLSSELFKAMAGVNIVSVPFNGNGPSIIGLLGGQVQLMFASVSAVAPHIKSGKLRALAVTSAQPSVLLPGLPTVAASGLPGYESESTHVVFAPAATPAAIIDRLNHEIVRVINAPDMKQRFFNAGIDIVGSSPEQPAARMKSEMARMGKVIKDAGIRAD